MSQDDGGAGPVLLLDDNQITLHMLSSFCEVLGLPYLCASSATAVDLLKNTQRPGAIVASAALPGLRELLEMTGHPISAGKAERPAITLLTTDMSLVPSGLRKFLTLQLPVRIDDFRRAVAPQDATCGGA